MKTILLFTANDPDDRLQMLATEAKDIQWKLNTALRKDYAVVLVPESTTGDIIQEFNVPGRRVEIFHYAGHSNATSVQFNDMSADAQALAEKLRNAGTVKLVFINGCASKGQVRFFHEAGIPFVVATSRPVGDVHAIWVAAQLYQYLSLGRSLRDAFKEVITDKKLQKKDINLAVYRDTSDTEEETADSSDFPWGLYIRETATQEPEDYSLPFSRETAGAQEAVNHLIFLDRLIFALESIDSVHFKHIKRLARNLQRGDVAQEEKETELLNALPYTLGLRIRKIIADPVDKSDEYYRDLLYEYAFLFETLLHHTASVFMAQLWQFIQLASQEKPNHIHEIASFWCKNRLEASPFDYKTLVAQLLSWHQRAAIQAPLSVEATTGIVHYLDSAAFKEACTYFLQQKRLFAQRVRLKEAEALEKCYIAQDHIIVAFEALKPLAAFFMASVRNIQVKSFRHVPTEYGNIVSKLVVDNAVPTSIFGDTPLDNKSVLWYASDDRNMDALLEVPDTLNLFPFIIDRNVFTQKEANEVDLYLFTGYFAGAEGHPCYHFTSVADPEKIWKFDETQQHVNLLHLGETTTTAHESNHLMANVGEFRSYLTQFKKTFFTL